ncbi:bis(5'-nucleosyl)-tetraphosphatase (symmetrical) YqeK [Alkaliphilus peptidifermentans]|uniref:bis(5'-nucleosyl)-tetraphosphatase (symmetrical) n=1 Tax=Alkaliphilus peptidifermentans DSM 18978 TaxID=1120976 RepID=A0A1G5J7P5_9FIRM|nr:bis(5'-nucleosyl)-tetraphosphatase (symmetrical) YqeK [Alkaliphilus peptidifermentans]SCY84234.1 putative HD superfamily hydrolase of NAD metabolism [Alkaliphilus peptidifermentans DSM 18978]
MKKKDFTETNDVLMDTYLLNNIKENLKEVISNKRYIHTMGVVDAAVYLAEKYGENCHKAAIAAVLHDYAKDFSEKALKEYIKENQIKVDDILTKAYQLLHGKVAASIAEKDYNISDKDILNAIENHTTGRKNMSKLEKIIYLSDFIEVGRSYPAVDELRLIAEEDLDKAVLKALDNTIVYVLSINKLLHPNTIEARNEILMNIE